MTERKDFEKWKVHVVYMAQEGRCKKCGGSLDFGMGTGESFEKHHADGDASNNSVENLQLLCKSCHQATLALSDEDYEKRYRKHRKLEEDTLDKLRDLCEKALNKELPSTSIERISEALALCLKLSTGINGINKGVFYPPPSIKALVDQRKIKAETAAILKGFEMGVRSVEIQIRKEEKY